ncbi:MAG: hypothetical protein Q8S96_19810 [Hydrogenophaga sp.]|uniref:hypothetical protein n=1 Tax=Hydrogenophaga sp. TaxID=1904254 RepID=UPI0027364276|nr:hypothetical protein [Hydrogenophaga sp.]MDP3346682.1 hypothetical protein [Hydrogenophaga sp.]
MSDFILTILYSAGTSAATIAVLTWLLRSWIGERLSAGIRHEYDQRIAELNARLKQQGEIATTQLKAEMDRFAEKLRHSAHSFSEMQKASHERKLSGVEDVWASVLAIEDAVPGSILFLDVLLDSEHSSALQNPKLGPELLAINHYKVIAHALETTKGIAVRRPFVGSVVWALSSTYRACLFRLIYLVSQCAEDPSKIHWYTDDLVRRHIKAGLGENKLSEFDALRTSRITWMRENFTRAILEAMDNIIAGRESSEAAIRQAQRMEKVLLESALAQEASQETPDN